jgi:16S rRNA (guanine527-N7)-methyltransferase
MEKFTQDVLDLIGVRLNLRQLSALNRYENELIEWNTRFNLTTIDTREGIRTKHFLDSLSCYLAMGDVPSSRIIDIGTGAGFPGIPLKIMLPQLQLTLVESVGKKAEFCRHIVQMLELDRVEVVQSRAEDIGQMSQYREKYDWAVARAVANLPILAEYLLPLVRVGGLAISQKGASGPEEAHRSEHAIQLLGGHLRQLRHITLPGVAEDRYLILIDKIAATPPQYPRRCGIPSKRPLLKESLPIK